MLPTLGGRIQTRIFLLAVVGGIVTLIITPLLPLGGGALSAKYQNTFVILAWVAIIGIAWECLYHFVMQWRWEKDWPTFFGLATGINEGLLISLLLGSLPGITGTVPTSAFVIDFAVVWIAVWVVANGPMRVPFLHWRFFGGRLV